MRRGIEMTINDFTKLISRAENETLDFKQEGYNLPGDRNAFIKDVLAMSNTPREHSAHIVFGVRWTPEDGSDVIGISKQFDDVELQDAFGHGRIQPHPQFYYTPLKYNDLQVGVLEIPVGNDGPYTAVKDYDGLQAGAVYYRRGTQNDRAVGTELRRIFTWFQSGNVGIPEEQVENAWPRFIDAVHRFQGGITYILAVDKIPQTAQAPVHTMGLPPWRAVFDFDFDSEANGFLSCVDGTLGHHRVIHRVVRGEYRVQPEPGTHWYFARGLSGRHETLCTGGYRDWLKSHKSELGQQLKRLASVISPSPVLALILWSDSSLRNYFRTFIEEIFSTFGDAVEVVVVSDDAPSFDALATELGATFVRLSLHSLCSGIAVHLADQQSTDEERYVLPSSSGAPIEVDAKDWLWLSEDLELLHRTVGLVGADDATGFRRGEEITWRNLHLNHDCNRDILAMLRTQVEVDIRRRQTVRINLYHAPGGGGTTLGRRIAWDLHAAVPVGVLKRCSPRDTAERIGKITALTESTVLLIVDGGQHSERDIDNLYEFLKANQTPVVLLQVLRRFRKQEVGKRQFWLAAQLTDAEADRIRDAYSKSAPLKAGQLTALAKRRGEPLRSAFFFGLTAFGRDFRGLDTHINRRIQRLTDEQRRLVVYIAMAHYYGQQSIPVQAFAQLLGLPRSKKLELTVAFADSSTHALDLLVESKPGEWRTAHHLIALEIMQQVFVSGDSRQRELVWRQNLSSWGKDFATFCRGNDNTTSDRMLELLRRVFVYRDNIDVLGTEQAASRRFAQLIEDIPSRNGKIEVLRHLTDLFPLEAHFHAHLGRFLGLNEEFTKALQSIDFAISIQNDDPVLHHMRGMALRHKMKASARVELNELIEIAKDASESFAMARRLGPDMEHGYVSEVQMLIDLIDHSGRGHRDVITEVLSRPETDPFLTQALDRAEDLLDRAENLYAGEVHNRFVLDCRARMQRIYGDYQSSLQGWDSLLSRPDVAKPPVRRQIVWTILRRREGLWDNLEQREADRIRHLLEDNLIEEVNDSTSLRLWLRAIRLSRTPPSLDSIIEKVSYWKTNTGSLDASYYLYVLHTLCALSGSSQGGADAERALEECRSLARFRRDRTRSFEWLGSGDGIVALIHQSRLGDWKDDFWESPGLLVRLEGRIAKIDKPQKGILEFTGGVQSFFVPGKSGFLLGRDENALVTCHLGFSYDGPQAWNVQRKVT